MKHQHIVWSNVQYQTINQYLNTVIKKKREKYIRDFKRAEEHKTVAPYYTAIVKKDEQFIKSVRIENTDNSDLV